MTLPSDDVNRALEDYRAYLETLTFIHINPRLRSKVGLSDVVQVTLLEAWGEMEHIQALDAEERKCYLRRMLVNNMIETIQKFLAQKRDYRREQTIEAVAEQSSRRLIDWMAAEESSLYTKLIKKEKRLRVLEALSQLPQREREALSLQMYHGWTLDEIAEYLECTANAVAGLQRRARGRLRETLRDLE
jgi:RNA polymerase sigma-70 factor (subfamily 1)